MEIGEPTNNHVNVNKEETKPRAVSIMIEHVPKEDGDGKTDELEVMFIYGNEKSSGYSVPISRIEGRGTPEQVHIMGTLELLDGDVLGVTIDDAIDFFSRIVEKLESHKYELEDS